MNNSSKTLYKSKRVYARVNVMRGNRGTVQGGYAQLECNEEAGERAGETEEEYKLL